MLCRTLNLLQGSGQLQVTATGQEIVPFFVVIMKDQEYLVP